MVTVVMLAHLAATWFMVGLIWFVQIVHYPMFADVGREVFARYAAIHQRATGFVVIPVMLVELATAGWLLAAFRNDVGSALAWAGAVMVVLIWLSTFTLQVPMHRKLSGGFDAQAWRFLVRTNWLRTVLWTARGGVTLAMLVNVLT